MEVFPVGEIDYKKEIISMIKDVDNYRLLKFIYGILCGAKKEEG